MLAKMWKKVLLAVCIIACIFNIMSKLVSRTSLELNLKSVENGESILSIFKEKKSNAADEITVETQSTPTENIVENSVVNQEETVSQPTEETTDQTQEESSPITDFVVIY